MITNTKNNSKELSISDIGISLILQQLEDKDTILLRDIAEDKKLVSASFRGDKARAKFNSLFQDIDMLDFDELTTRLSEFAKTKYEILNATIANYLNSLVQELENTQNGVSEVLAQLYGEIDVSEELKVNTKKATFIRDGDKCLYYRRSTKKQSSYELKHIITAYCKENESLFFADDTSSFKNIAFLEMLETCKNEGIREIEVLDPSRSAVETVTRSFEDAVLIVNYILQNHANFDYIKVSGLDLLDRTQTATFLLMVSTIESTWLSLANTQFYPKHVKYMKKAKGEKVELSKVEAKEYRALLNRNRTAKKLITWLEFLKFKSS